MSINKLYFLAYDNTNVEILKLLYFYKRLSIKTISFLLIVLVKPIFQVYKVNYVYFEKQLFFIAEFFDLLLDSYQHSGLHLHNTYRDYW